MQDFLKNSLLMLVSLAIALGILEFGSRFIYPVQYGNKYFSESGDPVLPANDDLTLKANLSFRQKTQEYDKATTHTARGFRGPAGSHMDPSMPDIVFIGDSMTYGIGLSDEETFPYLYCKDLRLACVNLGRPASSTVTQLQILKHYLDIYHWKPKKVNFVMNVMSSAMFGGNDLSDNVTDFRNIGKPANIKQTEDIQAKKPKGPIRNLISHREDILENSNLARLAYYIFAPALRSKFSPAFEMQQLQEAISITKDQLKLLDDMSKEYNFDYTIYIVHPMQDLINGTWPETQGVIKGAAAKQNIVDTAPALLESGDPVKYYYPLDGHVRPEGARLIADYMQAQLKVPQLSLSPVR